MVLYVVCAPFKLHIHLVLSQEHIWPWVVSKNVNQIPNEEPKVDNCSKCKHKAEPHIVRETIEASKVKQHQHWYKIYITNYNVETCIFICEHIIIEYHNTHKNFINKSEAQ